MRWFPVFCYLGIAVWQVGANIDLFFPSEASKRLALQECFTENHRFNPLDPAARASCFGAHAPPPMPRPRPQQANFVDLWRSHGQGPISGNDIRRWR